jgi:predicted CxxxxCH...CXXCH cytochrome family protein
MDPSLHANGGRAEVELSNPLAPVGSLKALSPAGQYTPGGATYQDATGLPYTLGTCTNVYCHSATTWATPSGVPRPGVDFPSTGYPITYPAYPLVTGRAFSSIGWGAANPGCGGCHGLPPRTAAPQVNAMAGQSHSYLDAQGYEYGHAWNHGFAPLSCRTCHAQTVTAANTTTRDALGVATYGPVPIVGFALHVNGRPDVVFDAVNPLPYTRPPLSLSTASYNQATSTCSNVACHFQQTAVRSGTPFREENTYECNACHQY